MQKVLSRTIDPRAFDLLVDESFIRQGDLVKAVQDSLQQGIDLEDLELHQTLLVLRASPGFEKVTRGLA